MTSCSADDRENGLEGGANPLMMVDEMRMNVKEDSFIVEEFDCGRRLLW